MAFSSNVRLLTPIMRSMIVGGPKACLPRSTMNAAGLSSLASIQSRFTQLTQQCNQIRQQSTFSRAPQDLVKQQSLSQILDVEIQEEMAELNSNLSSDQFPGFSVETDGADVKLTKQVGDSNVIVTFSVSSSIESWRTEPLADQQQSAEGEEGYNYVLQSMPDFHVQIMRKGKTLEAKCYFHNDMDEGEEDEQVSSEPMLCIDEIVMYEGEPEDNEFAVSTEYMREEMHDGLYNFFETHGIDHEFAKNLVSFATNYEKKQYIGLMKRLKEFVSN